MNPDRRGAIDNLLENYKCFSFKEKKSINDFQPFSLIGDSPENTEK